MMPDYLPRIDQYLPSAPSVSSDPEKHTDFFISRFSLAPCEIRVDPLSAHDISIHLDHAAHAERVIESRVEPGPILPGEVAITAAGQSFTWRCYEKVELLLVRVSASYVEALASAMGVMPKQGLSIASPFRVCDPLILQLSLALLEEVESEYHCATGSVQATASILASHLIRNYSNLEGRSQSTSDFSRKLHNILDYIDRSLDQPLKVRDLAALNNLSPSHFARLFTQYVGKTPHRYVLDKRTELAQRLLCESDEPISVIALKSGFSSQSHFSNAFKLQFGESPLQFRRMNCDQNFR